MGTRYLSRRPNEFAWWISSTSTEFGLAGVSHSNRIAEAVFNSQNETLEDEMSKTGAVLDALMQTITDRRDNPPERSYTTSLFSGGVKKIGSKITEEAAEVVAAAAEGTDQAARDHLTYEAADLIYHLFVMLRHRDIELSAVTDELQKRFGISGLDEKESRGQSDD